MSLIALYIGNEELKNIGQFPHAENVEIEWKTSTRR
jgi:hypothetical protein